MYRLASPCLCVRLSASNNAECGFMKFGIEDFYYSFWHIQISAKIRQQYLASGD
jgi:hypothetical protein